MTICDATRPREDTADRLVAELRRHLTAARGGESLDAEAALEQLTRLEKLVGLLRSTALQSFAQYEQGIFELSLIRNVGNLFGSVFDRSQLAQALTELVEEALPCDGVMLYLADATTGALELQCVSGPELDDEARRQSEQCACSVASAQDSAWIVRGPLDEAKALFCPVVAQSQVLGVIAVFEREPGSLSEGPVRTIADLASVALRHLRLWDEHRRQQIALEETVEERTREVSEARAALNRQERVSAMGKLAASIAHEVNNPMSFMISNLARASEAADELRQSLPTLLAAVEVARDLPAGEDPRIGEARAAAQRACEAARASDLPGLVDDFGELIEETREGADRIRHVGEELRGFAQGVTGVMEPVDVNTLVETAVHVARAEAKDRVEFELVLGILPPVRCNRYQVIQVLLNLLQNAIEAIAGPGSVRVTTRVVADLVEVEVADEGPGIDPCQIERIFEPFYSTKLQGTGLGLSISRDIAAAHRGCLEASGGPEGGLFRLRLPVS